MSPNYGSIKVHLVKQPTELCCRMIHYHAENPKLAKSFGPCQPAWTAQADVGRYFSQMRVAPLFMEQGSIIFYYCPIEIHLRHASDIHKEMVFEMGSN